MQGAHLAFEFSKTARVSADWFLFSIGWKFLPRFLVLFFLLVDENTGILPQCLKSVMGTLLSVEVRWALYWVLNSSSCIFWKLQWNSNSIWVPCIRILNMNKIIKGKFEPFAPRGYFVPQTTATGNDRPCKKTIDNIREQYEFRPILPNHFQAIIISCPCPNNVTFQSNDAQLCYHGRWYCTLL